MWKLYITGESNGSWNMAADEAMTEEFLQDSVPIFRLYRWTPTVSFGRSQNVSELADLKAFDSLDIGAVRRSTGGGALFHHNDLSYSVICSKNDFYNGSLKEGYRKLSSFLLKMYEAFGLKADYPLWEQKAGGKPSEICLAAKEPYDLQIQNKKVGGHAQRHTKGALFQHGTIPVTSYDPVFERLFFQSIDTNQTSLSELGVDTDFETVSTETIEAFEKSFGVKLKESSIDRNLAERIEDLKKNKYDRKAWLVHGQSA